MSLGGKAGGGGGGGDGGANCAWEGAKRITPTVSDAQQHTGNNNNVRLSCAHQRPERLHDTY